jgi:hypothetical protein
MGVDTKALLKGKIELIQLANDLVELYGTERQDISIHFTFDANFYKINFYHKNRPLFGRDSDAWAAMTAMKKWNQDNFRSMSVFYNLSDDLVEGVTTEECTYLSLGAWGESVEIMETLLKKYGGYIVRNDSTDDWEEFVS